MIRKVAFGVFAALFLGMAPQAQAIGPFLSWQNADDLDNGYGVGIAAPQNVLLIRIDPRVTWHSYGQGDIDLNAFPIDLIAELDLALFYGGVGVSYTIYDNDVPDRWGYSVVLGAKLKLGGIGVFGDLMWRGSEKKNNISVKGAGLNVGILFGN